MTTPTTAAGRALLVDMRSGIAALFSWETGDESDDAISLAILAVEQEAADTQDARDGRALRLLREAHPGWYVKAEHDPEDAPDMTVWYVAAWDQDHEGPMAWGHGDTLAAAAREALEARR